MTNHPAGKHLGVPTMAPAAFVTLHAHKSTDRTRIRVYASDDGSLPRVHLATITTNGDLDIALAAPAARDLAAQLQSAADACDDWYTPQPVPYTAPRLAAVNGVEVDQ